MTTNIYILKLENNKYYVGKTDNLEQRKQQHLNGSASSWTKNINRYQLKQLFQIAMITMKINTQKNIWQNME